MSSPNKWRVAHLGRNDVQSHDDFIRQFENAYQANNQPTRMAMFSHVDSFGTLMAVSITPESVPFCPFAETWPEDENAARFGNVGWVAGDIALK